MLSQKTLDFPIPALIGGLLPIGIFLLFFGLWYEIPGNAWDYLGVTANIYLASVFTLLVARLYWRRANATGAMAAIFPGAIAPLTFLIVNAKMIKALQSRKQPHPTERNAH